MRIQDYCRQIIREQGPQLSTGAYGDEGRVLRGLENIIESLMDRGEALHIACGLAWKRNSDVKDLDVIVRMPIVCVVSALANYAKPRRFVMTAEEIDASKADLFNLLRESEVRSGKEFRDIFEKYSRVMDAREGLELVRGGDEWLLLQRLDLFCCLGPWIIEIEKHPSPLEQGEV